METSKKTILQEIIKLYQLDLHDLEKIVILNNEIRNRMTESSLFKNYHGVMVLFGKRHRRKQPEQFAVNKVTVVVNGILKQYGLVIKSTRKRKRDGDKFSYTVSYKLEVMCKELTAIVVNALLNGQ